MRKSEFRQAAIDLLRGHVEEATLDDKLAIVHQAIIDVQREEEFDSSNRGNPWTDEELRVVLQLAPTKSNCIMLARAFRRGYGAVEQIFRWAAATGPEIEARRPDDAFIHQIKRIAKEVGWRAT